MFVGGRTTRRWLLACSLAVLQLTGCKHQAADVSNPSVKTPASGPPSGAEAHASAAPAGADGKVDLRAAVVEILHAAHRSGSVVLRGDCNPNAVYVTTVSTSPEMGEALDEVVRQYPEIYWRTAADGRVRVVDASLRAALLKVRIRRFVVIEDQSPDRVMAALWQTGEASAFLRKHHARLSRQLSTTGLKKVTSPILLQVTNATIAQVLDRTAEAYHSATPLVWTYTECTGTRGPVFDVQMK